MKRYRSLFLCLCLALLLVLPVSASSITEIGPVFSSLSPDMPTRLTALHTKLQIELYQYANICSGAITLRNSDVDDVRAFAQEQFETSFDSEADWIAIYYSEDTNEGTIAFGETVAAILTDEDVAAIEAAFAAPDTNDAYVHIVNGIKQLLICVFDGGEFELPAYSYAAEYLRDPNSELDDGLLPDTRIVVAEDRADDAKEAQCVYLANEIGRYAGLAVDIVQLPLDSSAVETAEGYRAVSEDADASLVLVYETDTGDTAVAMGSTAAALLPDDAEARLTSAMLEADGDDYDRAIAALEELAQMLFADGTREYSEFSGIALALDPDAFTESAGTPIAMWIALAVVLLAAALLAVDLRRRKKRAQ